MNLMKMGASFQASLHRQSQENMSLLPFEFSREKKALNQDW